MALFWEYLRTSFEETFLLWKKGEAVKKLATYLGAGALSAALALGYQISLTPQAWTVVAIGIAAWAALLVLVITPYRMWRTQRLRVIELEAQLSPSIKQAAIDDLSRELKWAIDNLFNSKPLPQDRGYWQVSSIKALWKNIDDWEKKIIENLGNRDVFTESDEINFTVLGAVPPFLMTGVQDVDKSLGMLNQKFDRLREIIRRHQS
jgi:hypothetical protein